MTPTPLRLFALALLLSAAPLSRADPGLGLFTDQADVGTVSRPGTAVFDASAGTYTVGSSGANMWSTSDAMHFVWRKAAGDLSISAAIRFVGTSAQGHRKACLVIRQNLTPGSAYVDVAQHGDGLTSIQFRDAQDGTTREIQSMLANPDRVRLDKVGDTVFLSVARAGEDPRPSGASFRLRFTEPFYVGIAVSAHDDKAFETAVFSRVEVGPSSPALAVVPDNLTIFTLPSGDRRVKEK
jgi:hypothetical protein